MASRMPSAPVDETIDVQPTVDEAPERPPPARTKQTGRKSQPPRRPRAANERTHIGRNVRRVLEQALMAVPEPEATEAVATAATSAPATPPARPMPMRFVSVYSPISLHSPGECDAFIALYQQQKAALEAQAEAAIIVVDTSSSSAESTPDHANRGSSQPE